MLSTARVELVGDQRLRQRDLDAVEEHLEDGVAGRGGLLEALASTQPLAQVGVQLVEGVELRGQLGEVVVELGELLLLHLAHRDGDVDLLADQVAADELGLEGLVLAGRHADQRLVEALDHLAAADLVGHRAHLGALDDLAVLHGLEIEDDEVAVGGGPLDVAQGGEALAQRVALLGDVVIGELEVLDLGLDALVLGQRDLGAHVDLDGELERLVVLDLGDLDLGLGHRLQRVLLHRLGVLLRQHLVDRLVQHGSTTDLTVDHHRRHLAATEARDVDLLGDLLVGRVEARLELVERNLDGELGPGGAQGLDGALHRGSP